MSALPGRSDVGLLGDGERVIDLDAEIAHRALDLGVAEQKLDRPQIAGAAVDQRGLGPAQRVRAVDSGSARSAYPFDQQPRILSGVDALLGRRARGKKSPEACRPVA